MMDKNLTVNLAKVVDSAMLDLLIDIILNNTTLDYDDKLTISDSKPILEFIKALDAESYETIETVRREKKYE